MNLRILEEAAAEFADAIGRYESIESGLGIRLKEEVKSVVDWIADPDRLAPRSFQGISPGQSQSFSLLHRLHPSCRCDLGSGHRPLRKIPGILDHPQNPGVNRPE
jgi:hypothetical protein